MKKKMLMAAVASTLCHSAFAQSSVTLYGVIEEGVRYATNQTTASGGAASKFSLSEGAIQGSRWGLKGSEDLGGGTAAIFDLQSGFNPGTGASDQQGQLFGRYAWFGLKNDRYGTLKLGRQYGTSFNFLANFDPLEIGNVTPDYWQILLVGLRFDNSVEYSNRVGPVSVEVQRSFGGQPGSANVGSTTAGSVLYQTGSLKTGVMGQKSVDAKGHSLYVGSVGGKYKFGATALNAYYIQARRDAGFSISSSNSGLPLANTSLIGNANTIAGTGTQTQARTDHLLALSGQYYATPTLALTLAGMYDWASNVAPDKSGKIGTIYGLVDYFLSKRTDVYLEMDYSHLYGASVTDPNSPIGTFGGKSGSFGAMVAMRTKF
ncbi:porin [Paraburkholderia tropica]|uniref:porin n=1 Tax=Paraburkholderia tropica TaxID=92647 RepID=UPI002AB2A65C|nr:porin [Paraburkholderia tropica]